MYYVLSKSSMVPFLSQIWFWNRYEISGLFAKLNYVFFYTKYCRYILSQVFL